MFEDEQPVHPRQLFTNIHFSLMQFIIHQVSLFTGEQNHIRLPGNDTHTPFSQSCIIHHFIRVNTNSKPSSQYFNFQFIRIHNKRTTRISLNFEIHFALYFHLSGRTGKTLRETNTRFGIQTHRRSVSKNQRVLTSSWNIQTMITYRIPGPIHRLIK